MPRYVGKSREWVVFIGAMTQIPSYKFYSPRDQRVKECVFSAESEIRGLGSVNLLLFFRSPSPIQAERNNELNVVSRTLT